MFSYVLSCKIKRREFIDRTFFYAGYEKREIKKKRLDQGTVVTQTPSFTTWKGLRLFTSQQISSGENQHFQNKLNTSTVTDRLPTVP